VSIEGTAESVDFDIILGQGMTTPENYGELGQTLLLKLQVLDVGENVLLVGQAGMARTCSGKFRSWLAGARF